MQRLMPEARAIVQEREVRERLIREGADPVGSTPQEFAAYVKTEGRKWVDVARAANIKQDDRTRSGRLKRNGS
jgi:tripartite-type tricarboxylate transporter receptor subunit TctC